MRRARREAIEDVRRELLYLHAWRAVALEAMASAHEVLNSASAVALNSELLDLELGAMTRSQSRGAQDEAREICASIHRESDRTIALLRDLLARVRARAPVGSAIEDRVDALCAQLRAPTLVDRILGRR